MTTKLAKAPTIKAPSLGAETEALLKGWIAQVSVPVEAVSNYLQSIDATKQEGMAALEQLYKELADARDELERVRKTYTQPLLNLKRAYDAVFAAPVNSMGVALNMAKTAITAATATADQARELALKQIEAEVQSGVKVSHDAVVKAHVAPVAQETTKQRTLWKFEITDESKLPREFLRPDPEKIKAYVKGNKKVGEHLNGAIRVFKEKVVSR